MTPDQLLTFAVVAELRNISRASDALHLSQPAVSGQLRLLQQAFGEPLYLRDGRGIRLTAAGEQLAAHAQRLRAVYRQAADYRDALRGLSAGRLRIGASTTPASYLLPYLVAAFRRRHPQVALATAYGNTAEVVAQLDTLDLAFIEGPAPDDLAAGTAVQPWRDDEIVAVVPIGHPLAAAPDASVTLTALAAHPLIWREPGSGVRQAVEQAFRQCGIAMRAELELAGVEGVKEAVRAGMGVGFVSAMAMRHEDAALRSVRIAPSGTLRRRFSILVPHASAASQAARAFLALCADAGAELR